MFVKEFCTIVSGSRCKDPRRISPDLVSKGTPVGKAATPRQGKPISVIDLDAHPEAELFSREAHPSSTRVLLAGLQSFAELGYHGTATRDITRKAGVSAGALYTHFESKQAILQEISRVTHAAMYNRMRRASEGPSSPAERLAALVREHASFHARYPTAGRVANYELHSLDADARAEMQEYRRGMEGMVTDVVNAGQEAGQFSVPNVKIFSKFILSSGIDISRWFRADGNLGPDDLGALYAEMVLSAAHAEWPPTPVPSSGSASASRPPRKPTATRTAAAASTKQTPKKPPKARAGRSGRVSEA
jgi:AcrR family transcriptional regulator